MNRRTFLELGASSVAMPWVLTASGAAAREARYPSLPALADLVGAIRR